MSVFFNDRAQYPFTCQLPSCGNRAAAGSFNVVVIGPPTEKLPKGERWRYDSFACALNHAKASDGERAEIIGERDRRDAIAKLKAAGGRSETGAEVCCPSCGSALVLILDKSGQ